MVVTRGDEADWLSIWAAIIVAEKEWLLRPLRTARNRRTRTRMYGGVGAGGETLPATRLGHCMVPTPVLGRGSKRSLVLRPFV